MNGKKEKRIGLLKRGCAWMLMAALVFGQPQTALAECRSENTKRTEEFSLPENAEEFTYPAEEETPEKMLNTVMTDEADSASEGISSPDESEGNAVGEDPASDGDSTNDESSANDENSKDAGDPIIDGYPEVYGNPAVDGNLTVDGNPAVDGNLTVDGDPTVDGDLAGGRYQNIEWRIDANGKLIVTGSTINQWGRQSVIKGFWPWGNQDTPRLVKSAEIRLADAVDLSGMFRHCTNMESVDFSGTDTSQVTDMSDMFVFNDSLTTICFGDSFDTSKVTDMSGMFGECMKLESLDVSGFDTSKVTDMSGMFGGCWNLKTLDVSGFDTSKVTNMRWMFNGCRNLKSLDLSGFRTDRVTDFSFMFNGCTGLEKLDLKGFNTAQATDMQYMFSGCENLTKLNMTGFQTGKVTTMSGMFGGLKSLKTLDVSGFDTSCVTEMNGMFDSCESLETLDVSGFQTGAVRSMLGMFSGCRQVQMLDVSGFDTSLVTDMQSMFYNCESIRELELSHFSTSLVTSMDSMFYGCRKLKKLDLSSFDTTHVTNMTMMVFYCDALEELDLESFDMSAVEASYPPCENSICPDCRYMFRSQNLARIRTPKQLLFIIELPTSGWKLNGTPVTNLPYNRDESVLLTRSGNSKAPAITSILLDQQAVQLTAGETVNLTAKISPEGADPSRLIWSSSDTEVAKVEGNSTFAVVTGGEKAGSAQITVRSGSVRAACQVTVRVPLAFDRKKITFTAREGAASSFKLLADASDRERIQMTVTDEEGAVLTDFLEITKDPSDEGRYTVCLQSDAVITDTRTAVIRASLNKDDREYQAACTVCVNPLPVTASPGADVPSGTVKINTPVSLRTSTRGAIIFYTTDGSEPVTGTDRTTPGETALPYQDPIRVTKDMTIKAAAVRQDYQTGETAAFVYTVDSGAWGDVIDEGLKSLFDGKAQLVPDGLWIAFRTEDGWDGKIYTASVPEGAPASFTDTLSTGLHMTYTGEKLSPSDRMEVYHGTRRLSENRDYTVSCVNNLHASDL
ncbi:MAG: BspA family leucine-rich repeat surface protein, partial [Lachnospiraceae bacterium]|nr:BspA family leucine-rich repeat surface protein [Lachnospiraceae bacterium]